jgi:hypothetical protein
VKKSWHGAGGGLALSQKNTPTDKRSLVNGGKKKKRKEKKNAEHTSTKTEGDDDAAARAKRCAGHEAVAAACGEPHKHGLEAAARGKRVLAHTQLLFLLSFSFFFLEAALLCAPRRLCCR